jgi:hypothetical protein
VTACGFGSPTEAVGTSTPTGSMTDRRPRGGHKSPHAQAGGSMRRPSRKPPAVF